MAGHRPEQLQPLVGLKARPGSWCATRPCAGGDLMATAVETCHRRGCRQRLEVEERGQQLGPGDAVDDGVMHLDDYRDPSIRQSIDHVHLPQWPAAVEGTRGEVGNQALEFLPATRPRQSRPSNVVVEVGELVLDEPGVTEAERRGNQSHAERSHQLDPFGDECTDAAERQLERLIAGVEDEDADDVEMGRRGLEGQEGRVETGHTLYLARPAGSAGHAPYRPVDPKPPRPRSLSGSSGTGENVARSTGWMTSWAMRSPRWTS